MNRDEFRRAFGNPTVVVFPVIHVLDNAQALRNVTIARDAGCPGVFLINHDFTYPEFLPIIRYVRKNFPDYWMGVNFLAITGKDAFPVLAELEAEGVRVDAYWADDARIDETRVIDDQPEAQKMLQVKKKCGWNGLYFGGTAFKKQRDVDPDAYAASAGIARTYMDIVTTSGIATGHSADHTKMQTFRKACGQRPLALASGITPDNVADYQRWVDAVLVATGINFDDDFYNIDPQRLSTLLARCRAT